MALTPDLIAKDNSEHSQQVALFMWASEHLRENRHPELRWMFAIPNGGERRISVAAGLKAEGVKAGVSDVFLPLSQTSAFGEVTGYCGLFIEMKRPHPRGRTSDEQDEFLAAMRSAGYATVVCWHWKEAAQAILEYLDGSFVQKG